MLRNTSHRKQYNFDDALLIFKRFNHLHDSLAIFNQILHRHPATAAIDHHHGHPSVLASNSCSLSSSSTSPCSPSASSLSPASASASTWRNRVERLPSRLAPPSLPFSFAGSGQDIGAHLPECSACCCRVLVASPGDTRQQQRRLRHARCVVEGVGARRRASGRRVGN